MDTMGSTIPGVPLRLQALDVASDGLLVAAPDGRVLFVQPALAKRLGLDPGRLPPLTSLAARFQLPHGAGLLSVLHSSETDGYWSGEVLENTSGGPPRRWNLVIHPLREETGKRLATLWLMRNQEVESTVEKQMIQAQHMQLLENLAGGMAHEFRNLLTIVVAYSSILQERLNDSELRADLLRIQEAGKAANELAARLLSFIRRHTPTLEEVAPEGVLADLSGLLAKSLPKNISLVMPDHLLLPRIRADRNLLFRALLNLCFNARDAMPEGGKLTLEAEQVHFEPQDMLACPERPAGHYVILAVTDTGHGMNAEVKGRIFEPFFSTKAQGTGLGLLVVRHIIQAMGGWLTLYSEVGLGTCVRLYLPVAGQSVPVARIADEPPGPTGTETVLVVDDDPLALNVTQRLLQKSGYKTVPAAGGEEAIRIYREQGRRIALVLLDVVMPYVNGEEVYREISRLNPSVKILLMSGFTPKTAERLVKAAGARYMAKPFTQGSLALAVRSVLDAAG